MNLHRISDEIAGADRQAGTGSRLKLLFVDDDSDIRAIIGLSLALDPELDLRCAGGGREALALLRDVAWQPDCVLLDAQMPDLTGEAVLKAIRSEPRATDLPVILLTANVRPSDIERYLGLGALGVIPKPFDPITLAGDVRVMLEQGRR